jgi:hypothetical protein
MRQKHLGSRVLRLSQQQTQQPWQRKDYTEACNTVAHQSVEKDLTSSLFLQIACTSPFLGGRVTAFFALLLVVGCRQGYWIVLFLLSLVIQFLEDL